MKIRDLLSCLGFFVAYVIYLSLLAWLWGHCRPAFWGVLGVAMVLIALSWALERRGA